jgi:hypothetical protein
MRIFMVDRRNLTRPQDHTNAPQAQGEGHEAVPQAQTNASVGDELNLDDIVSDPALMSKYVSILLKIETKLEDHTY